MTSDQKTFPVLKLKSTAQADLVLLMTDVRIFLSSDRLRIFFFWLNNRDGWPLVALHLLWSFGSFGTNNYSYAEDLGSYLFIPMYTVTLDSPHPVDTYLRAGTGCLAFINI